MTTLDLTDEERRVRRAHLSVCTVLLAVVAATYLGAVLLLRPDLPDRLAVHFGADGVSDGWMGTTWALVLFGLLAIGLPAVLLVVFAAGQWWRGSSARATSALVCGLAAGLTSLFVHLLWSQQGLDGVSPVRLRLGGVLWPLASGVGVGLLAAAMLPRPLPQPDPLPAEPMPVGSSDRVSWFGRARSSQALVWVLLGAVLVVVVATLASGLWGMWLVVLLLLLVFPAVSIFRVTVDRSGLTWRSALGVPRGHVPLAEITGVGVVEVRAGDFGGYGIRSAPGATAVVTRSGPALQVERGSSRRFVITVEDPIMAASVLEGLRRRG